MPKAGKCNTCLSAQNAKEHDCLRHSDCAPNRNSAVWNPSRCSDCKKLFDQADKGDLETSKVAKSRIRDIFNKAKQLVPRENYYKGTILSSESENFIRSWLPRSMEEKQRLKSKQGGQKGEFLVTLL